MHSEPAPVRENVPLAPYATLGVGGPARFMIEATQESHVLDALEFARAGALPVFVLGGGSNILISDSGFPGLVLRIALRGMSWKPEGALTLAIAAAGEDWDAFVVRCLDQDLSGIECLSGIPGTVGGTPVQNVGAYGQEVSELIVSVRVVDREAQRITNLANAECEFSYRKSIFNSGQPDRYIVLGVTFGLHPGGEPLIQYADLRRYFAGKDSPPSLAETRTAVLKIRAGKGMVLVPDDPDSRSAGSFFKNPIVSEEAAGRAEEAARLQGRLRASESLPRFKTAKNTVKLPAAWLIERAGFPKGYSHGRVGLSSKHSLSVVNRGGASASEILEFMGEIQCGVKAAFGIDLSPEPVFVGF